MCGLVLIAAQANTFAADDRRDRPFDGGWLFHRGDASGAEQAEFDDSSWRALDLPHDWSIEDLPPVETDAVEVEAVTGEWRFHRGDDASWSDPDFDDSGWVAVRLPASWEQHSGYTDANAYGWLRRRLDLSEVQSDRPIVLLLGKIDDADQAFLNGKLIGQSGSFPPDYRTAWSDERRYLAPPGLVRGDGSDVLVVRVFDGDGDGGIYTAGQQSERIGPFAPTESEGRDKTGYVVGGVGWYRKHFATPQGDKRVAVRFDGVYMDAEVWLNGHHLGNHPNGYTSFELDLTPHLRPAGEANVLAVCVRNEGKNSRWYSGSGIYRHAWLTVRDAVHVPTWGLSVSTPEATDESASVLVRTEVHNASSTAVDAYVTLRLSDPSGGLIGEAQASVNLPVGVTRFVEQLVRVPAPSLWSPDSASLYEATAEVMVDGESTDSVSTPFGIRSVEIDTLNGLRLNGEPLLLRGGCVHHDNGPLGAAAIDRAVERKVELLKANGFNAIRTSHNPPAPALLDACDRLGVLVINEAFDQWNEQKLDNSEDYHRYFDQWAERDIASMVRRDRNHPSVIMWSIGNEIPEQFRAEPTQLRLRQAVLAHDDTRPITQAICTDWGEVIRNWNRLSDRAFTHLDVAGYNYLPAECVADHTRHPDRVMYGSESYPKDALAYWRLAEEKPYVIGDFVWTAIDYLGESGIAHAVRSDEPNPFFMSWPWHNAWCGDLDICGFKKPQSYYRDVVWRRSPLEMAVHEPKAEGVEEVVSWWGWPKQVRSWNWAGHEGEPLTVSIYTRADTVRLELDGEVIGEQSVSQSDKLTATFDTPYEPGELRAVAWADGLIVGETALSTTGAPAALRLNVDRCEIADSRDDLAYVTVEVVDESGARVPDAVAQVRFCVEGPGELAAQASGAPNRPASFRLPECATFRGRCLAILRPTGGVGEIVLRAESEGLRPAALPVRVTTVEGHRSSVILGTHQE